MFPVCLRSYTQTAKKQIHLPHPPVIQLGVLSIYLWVNSLFQQGKVKLSKNSLNRWNMQDTYFPWGYRARCSIEMHPLITWKWRQHVLSGFPEFWFPRFFGMLANLQRFPGWSLFFCQEGTIWWKFAIFCLNLSEFSFFSL